MKYLLLHFQVFLRKKISISGCWRHLTVITRQHWVTSPYQKMYRRWILSPWRLVSWIVFGVERSETSKASPNPALVTWWDPWAYLSDGSGRDRNATTDDSSTTSRLRYWRRTWPISSDQSRRHQALTTRASHSWVCAVASSNSSKSPDIPSVRTRLRSSPKPERPLRKDGAHSCN